MGSVLGCLKPTDPGVANYGPRNLTGQPTNVLTDNFVGAAPAPSAAVETAPSTSAAVGTAPPSLPPRGLAALSLSPPPPPPPKLALPTAPSTVTRAQLGDWSREEQKKLLLEITNGEPRVPGNNRSERLAYMVCCGQSLKKGLFDELKNFIKELGSLEQGRLVKVIMAKNNIIKERDRIWGPYYLAQLHDTLKEEAFKVYLSFGLQPVTFTEKEIFKNFAGMTPAQQKMTISEFKQIVQEKNENNENIDECIINYLSTIIRSASCHGNDEAKKCVLELSKIVRFQKEGIRIRLIHCINQIVIGRDDANFMDQVIARLDPTGTTAVVAYYPQNLLSQNPSTSAPRPIIHPTDVNKLNYTQQKHLINQIRQGQACVPGANKGERLAFIYSCQPYLEERLFNDAKNMVGELNASEQRALLDAITNKNSPHDVVLELASPNKEAKIIGSGGQKGKDKFCSFHALTTKEQESTLKELQANPTQIENMANVIRTTGKYGDENTKKRVLDFIDVIKSKISSANLSLLIGSLSSMRLDEDKEVFRRQEEFLRKVLAKLDTSTEPRLVEYEWSQAQ